MTAFLLEAARRYLAQEGRFTSRPSCDLQIYRNCVHIVPILIKIHALGKELALSVSAMQALSLVELSSVIAELYAAVHSPARLLPALQQLEKLLDVDMIHLLVNTLDEKQAPLQVVTSNSFHSAAASYNSHFSAIDPRKMILKKYEVGRFTFCEEMFDKNFISKDEFYQDWLIPNGGRYTAGGCVYRDEYNHAHLAIHHFSARGPFGKSKSNLIKLIMPHVVQAMKMWMQSENLRQASLLSQWALDKLQYGLLAVTTQGKICYANQTAESILIKLTGEFKLNYLATHGTLWALIQRCLLQDSPSSTQIKTEAGAVFCLAMPAGRTLPGMQLPTWHQGEAQFLLILSNHRQHRIAPAGQFAELFGLSAAESRLAHSLASGGSLESHAENFCISINTVRTQLRHLLLKTGESRQQDLVRKLVMIPAF